MIEDTEMPKNMPQVGQIWGEVRVDPYYASIEPDSDGRSKKEIEIIEVLPNGVRAKVKCDGFGKPYAKDRFTTMVLKTLNAGYALKSR
jgi:hypothetical protein